MRRGVKVAAFRRRWGAGEELAERLAAEGLLARGRGGASAVDSDFAPALVRALAAGPAVDAAFARWLAGRVHLLAPTACRTLVCVPDPRQDAAADPADTEEIRRLLHDELGAAAVDCLAEIDARPAALTPFRRRYRGRLADGRAVDVVLARPETARELTAERWAPLALALDTAGLPGDELIAGFRRTARRELDLEREADLLADLAADAASFPALVVPRVLVEGGRRCATTAVLIREALPGEAPPGAPPAAGLTRTAYVWLRQVALGRAFPLRPAGDGVLLSDDGRVTWVEGPFATLPAASQIQLWSYLLAALDEDLPAVCERLVPELIRAHGAGGQGGGSRAAGGHGVRGEEELRLRLRQLTTIREGSLGEGVDPLADELFAALRIARDCGFAPRRPLADFAASAFELASAALDAAPGAAPVQRALDELRLERSAAELRHAWLPAALGTLPADYMRVLMELPEKLDAALDLLARGEVGVRLQGAPPSRDSSAHRTRGFRGPALAAVAAVIWLAVPRLGELVANGLDAGQAGGLAAALLAAILVGSRLGGR